MNYRQVETSREIRLWITQVILPAIGVGAVILSNDTAREYIFGKAKTIKNKIGDKFKLKNV